MSNETKEFDRLCEGIWAAIELEFERETAAASSNYQDRLIRLEKARRSRDTAALETLRQELRPAATAQK